MTEPSVETKDKPKLREKLFGDGKIMGMSPDLFAVLAGTTGAAIAEPGTWQSRLGTSAAQLGQGNLMAQQQAQQQEQTRKLLMDNLAGSGLDLSGLGDLGQPVPRGLTLEQASTVGASGANNLGGIINLLTGQQVEQRAQELQPHEVALRAAQAEGKQEEVLATRAQREYEQSPEGRALKQAAQRVEEVKARAAEMKAQADMASVPAQIQQANAKLAEAENKLAELTMLQSTIEALNAADATVTVAGQEIPLSMSFVNPQAFGAIANITGTPGAKQVFAQTLVDLGYVDDLHLANQMLEEETPLGVFYKAIVSAAGGPIGLSPDKVGKIQEAIEIATEGAGGTADEQAAAQRIIQEMLRSGQ